MASFTKEAFSTPFGRNVFLRSTQDVKTLSRTLAASTVPERTIDGHGGQKVLQPGTVLATIVSGPETGKVGPFQAAGTDEVQVLTKAGTVSGGTFDLTVLGVQVLAIAWDATASALQTAIRAAIAASSATATIKAIGDGITVTGGPIASTPFTITYNAEVSADLAQITAVTTSLTGAGAGITPSTSTPGVAGATDGRGDTANIVGICNTFLPWQLMERDVEVAVIYQAAVVQANCIELDASGAEVALGNTTAAEMFGKKHIDINFVS